MAFDMDLKSLCRGSDLKKKLFLKISQYSQENTCEWATGEGLKRLEQSCFPLKIAKFFTAAILKNIRERLHTSVSAVDRTYLQNSDTPLFTCGERKKKKVNVKKLQNITLTIVDF